MKINRKYLIIGSIILAGLFMIWNTFSIKGIQDLKGDFKELAFYRNENNTGPVQRVYAVSISDTLWNEMEQYGQFMPHTKYGNTKVYFFKTGTEYPNVLSPGDKNFEAQFEKYCIARFEKENMGNVTFQKYPFSN